MRKRWAFLLGYGLLLAASHAARPRDFPPGQNALLQYGEHATRLPDGVRLAWRELPGSEPDAAPVVLLHGSPGSCADLGALAARLPGERRRLTPDLPGFGHSSREIPDYSVQAHARYVLAWLDQLGIERAHFVSHSMGGGVALEIAGMAPERALSLTQIAAIGAVELELLGSPALNRAVHGAQLAALRALTLGTPHFGLLDRSPLNVAYARNFYDTDQRRLRPLLEQYAGPMLIVHGVDDPLVPVAAAREHRRIVPQSELVELPTDHFLVFGDPTEVAGIVGEFLGEVDAGRARTRDQATPERLAAAAKPWSPADAPVATGPALLVLGALLAIATLVSEDLTCISAGLLVADGRLPYPAASIACFVGIFLGDMGLVLMGRTLGRAALASPPLSWWISPAAIDQASAWYRRYGPQVILTSRFTPGTRLPLYVAAGALKTPILTFVRYFVLAAGLWTPLLVGGAALAGEPLLAWLERAEYGVTALLPLVLLLVLALRRLSPLLTWRGRRLALGWWRRRTRWEFWPSWAVYPPVVLALLPDLLRYRPPTVFTAANPGIPAGGFVGESKQDIYRRMGGAANPYLPRTLFLDSALSAEERLERAERFQAAEGLGFPVVLKPDAGQRGQGVLVAHSREDVARYLAVTTNPTLLQEHVPGREYGIFYVRRPDEPGRIFSITDKRPLSVVGDGRRTLEELILADDRAVCMGELHLRVHAARLADVPAAGEVVAVVEVGTHSRGSLFLDGGRLATPALTEAVDRLSRSFEGGFYFGRYDVRAADEAALQRGELRVIEVNGVTSESTNIYDPRHPVQYGWRTLRDQWRLALEIGAMNRDRGAAVAGVGELIAMWWGYRRTRKGQPAVDRPLP